MESEQEIVFLVLTGVVFMLMIALVVIYFVFAHRKKYLQQQNELQRIKNEKDLSVLRAIVKTQEEERSRIAQNLHDSVGVSLSMLQHKLSKHLHHLKPLPKEVEGMETDVLSLEETIDNIRRACKNLYPVTVKNMGLLSALAKMTQQLEESGKLSCELQCLLSENELPDDLELKVNCFRVCQELINNILKHSGSTHLLIHLSCSEQLFRLHFKHNGKKFTNEDAEKIIQSSQGIGLNSIHNRLELMQGKINYGGTRDFSYVLLEIPYSHEQQN